jgi:tRNA(adenine34) deaminase
MHEALALADYARLQGEVPIGAVIVSNENEIIGRGWNCVERSGCQDGHAEMQAIRHACHHTGNWRLDGCTIYVTLEPCIMCLGLVLLSRVEQIVYAADSPRYGFRVIEQDVLQVYQKHVKSIRSGVCKDESTALLHAFFTEQRA